MNPRQYQIDSIDKCRESFKKGNRHIALCLCGGAGKSLVAKIILESAKGKLGFFSYRNLLIDQIKTYFLNSDKDIHFGTIQKFGKEETEQYDLVIIDESWGHGSKLKNNIKSRFSITLTGTPYDESGYKLDFDEIIDGVQLPDLIDMGYAKDLRILCPIDVDMRDVKVNRDFTQAQGYEIMSKSEITKNIIDVYNKHAVGRKTMLFAVNTMHAEELKTQFVGAGINADTVHSKKGSEAVVDFRNGDIDVIISVDMLNVGYDNPEVNCLMLCRPTRSIPLMMQTIWRGTRKDYNNPDADLLVLDCANVIRNTIHPKQRMTFNREKPKNKKDLCDCGGSKKLLNKTVSEPDADGFYLVTTIRKCDRCPNIFTDEKMHLIPVSECGCTPNNEMTMREDNDKIVWSLKCKTCGHEAEYRSILYNEAELQEIAPPLPRDNWDAIKMELRKATRADGKKVHYKWADHAVFHLQLIGADPKMVIDEIDRYNANGWKLGGIQYAIEKKIKGDVR